MRTRISACIVGLLFMLACNKKESGELAGKGMGEAAAEAAKMVVPICAKEIITEEPVKVGETGIVLPVKSKLCFSADNLEIRIELPEGYGFLVNGENKLLPVLATYTCVCSAAGSACQVFYAQGLGFGCLQSSCSGSCTGRFTYKGYTVNRVVRTDSKDAFFNLPEVQAEIAKIDTKEPYSEHAVYGVSFFIVNDESKFLAAATCDCEGTQACKLKKLSIPLVATIYFCEGSCNGCELTV